MNTESNPWVQFWYCPWINCDVSWKERFPLLNALGFEKTISHLHCSDILAATDTEYRQPPVKNDVLLTLVSMTKEERDFSLNLATEIITQGKSEVLLDEDHQTWCRRISGGLRPAGWISDSELLKDIPLGSFFFYQWADSLCLWDRARWLFDSNFESDFREVPHQKVTVKQLNTLWGAVFWQATRPVPR